MPERKDIYHSGKAPEPVGAYPHARKAGNFLFLSGMGPREKGKKDIPGVQQDDQGNVLSYDIEKQTHSVFKNVKDVLEDAGSRWENLVDVQVFLTDMKKDFKPFNKLWKAYFPENPPCRTTVEIKSLPTPIAVELKCIATL